MFSLFICSKLFNFASVVHQISDSLVQKGYNTGIKHKESWCFSAYTCM